MVVQCSQMFANIQHSITVFNEHLIDVCEDSSKCEKRFVSGWAEIVEVGYLELTVLHLHENC